jgi:hypothetical protein
VAGTLSEAAAAAWVPGTTAASVSKTVLLIAAGKATPPAAVAALTQGALKAMLFDKLKMGMAVLVVMAVIGATATGLLHSTHAADQPKASSGDFKGQFVFVVTGKAGAMFEKPQIRELGHNTFIVGLSVKSDFTSDDNFINGRIIWLPLKDVVQIIEFDNREQIGAGKKTNP